MHTVLVRLQARPSGPVRWLWHRPSLPATHAHPSLCLSDPARWRSHGCRAGRAACRDFWSG